MIARIKDAQKKLARQKVDALLISSAYNVGYLTGFFGFSPTEREGYFLLTENLAYIFAGGLNSEAIKNHIANLKSITLVEISPRSPITKKALARIIKKEKIKKLGFEKQNLTFAEYERLKKDLAVSLIPTEYVVEELRIIKDEEEIAAIEKACTLGNKAFSHILTKIKLGITEKELAFELEHFIRKNGAEPSFPTIVAFGMNSAVPHHVTSNERLTHSPPTGGSGQATIILLDFGVKVDHYCSDMTRTVFFGKASSEQRRMYQTVLEAQKRATEYLGLSFRAKSRNLTHHEANVKDSSTHPLDLVGMTQGVLAKKIDQVARSYITSQRFPTIPHSLGHGIGLEVHEPPRLSQKSKDALQPGMVFSIEPGIYQPGIGGIRIEDLVVIESNGPTRLLTKSKRELIEM